jgi:hypothetical protein
MVIVRNCRGGRVKKNTRLNIRVNHIDKKGNIIKEYSSMGEAARELGVHHAAISKVCRGIFKQTGGHRFEFACEDDLKVKRSYTKPVKIRHLTKEGKLVKIYESPTEAALDLNVSPSNIHLVCKGTYKTTGGHRFEYEKQTKER